MLDDLKVFDRIENTARDKTVSSTGERKRDFVVIEHLRRPSHASEGVIRP